MRVRESNPGAVWPLMAVGAIAVGAIAISAIAIGRLAIGRVGVGKLRLRDVEIETLTVRHLRVLQSQESKALPPRSASILSKARTPSPY